MTQYERPPGVSRRCRAWSTCIRARSRTVEGLPELDLGEIEDPIVVAAMKKLEARATRLARLCQLSCTRCADGQAAGRLSRSKTSSNHLERVPGQKFRLSATYEDVGRRL